METNLRKLLVEADKPGVYDLGGQTVLMISELGDRILSLSPTRRFFPPLVTYEYSSPEMAERALQEGILALFEAAATYQGDLPEVPFTGLVGFFQEQLGDDDLRVLVGDEDLAKGLEGTQVFLGAGTFAIGIKGKPGAIVTTPLGVGMFIQDVEAVAGARIAA